MYDDIYPFDSANFHKLFTFKSISVERTIVKVVQFSHIMIKEQKNIDHLNRYDLLAEDRELYELLDSYADAPILPDKDREVKNMLLRVELKAQLVALVAVQPDVSFKEAVFALMNRLPENESDIAYHLVVHVVAKYLSTLSSSSLATA